MITTEEVLNARILIVDDREENVELLEGMLTTEGYTSILGITDPRETIAMYEAYRPDLILLDINMPQMDGFQVMEKLNEVEKGDYIPVLILTAQQDDETRIRALSSGAKDFLSKPFHMIETMTRIRNMIEIRLMHNQSKNQAIILEKMVRDRTAELHETRLEVIRRLGLAAEYRDNETGYHIIRMSKMSKVLGEAAGMDQDAADVLLNASPMHDIGKIGIPDRVLLKPGKLDAEEWDIMQTHAEIGGVMLDGHSSPLLVMAKEIALTHHEKWNGAGYPKGLKEEEIPLAGRVCAIADVFDALTSERPYKKPWSVEDSVAEIDNQKGAHFDPQLVDLFHTVLDEFVSIKNEYQEPDP